MKRISRLEWDENNQEHLSRHGVTPEEVEEVCFSRPVILRGRSDSRSAYGLSGRYLFIVLRLRETGIARCITARDMTAKKLSQNCGTGVSPVGVPRASRPWSTAETAVPHQNTGETPVPHHF